MKFGVHTFITSEGASPGVLVRALEDRDFESLWLGEHSHIPVHGGTPFPGGGEIPDRYRRSWSPFVALAYAASASTTLTLGTAVALLPQRDVIHTAKDVATLDLLAGGRFRLGIGVGWNRSELRNHGVDPSTRGRLVDEQIAAMKAIWSEDEAEYHGEFIDFDPIFCWPKPLTKPHPPIYIGGSGEAAIARVRRHSAGWMPNAVADVHLIGAQISAAGDQAGSPPITITAMDSRNRAVLEGYLGHAEVERIAFVIPPLSESETLIELDSLAEMIQGYDAASASPEVRDFA